MIAIADYGVGNLGSIVNMIRRAGVDVVRATTNDVIDVADAVVLPGVGAYDACVSALEQSGLVPSLERAALVDRRPFLGICVGMQLLCESSEEGDRAGLGWIGGRCRRLAATPTVKVPHMGWSEINVRRENAVLEAQVDSRPPRFYFLHSYAMDCADPCDVIATAEHGGEFVCAIGRDNVFGVQFHPEKSHRYGLELFRRFASL